jgi:hypothetical protein
MSMGPDDPRDDADRDDQDREPNSPAGAASRQAELADDKEQSEGDPDRP